MSESDLSFQDVLERIARKEVDKILQGLVATVASFDPRTMRADVNPSLTILVDGVATPLPKISNIRVLSFWSNDFYMVPDYKPGNLVWITFSTHEIFRGIAGGVDAQSEATNSTSYAVLSHGIAPTGFIPPDEFSDPGIKIGHLDGDAYIQIEKDAITIKIEKDQTFKFDSNGLTISGGKGITIEDGGDVKLTEANASLRDDNILGIFGPGTAHIAGGLPRGVD